MSLPLVALTSWQMVDASVSARPLLLSIPDSLSHPSDSLLTVVLLTVGFCLLVVAFLAGLLRLSTRRAEYQSMSYLGLFLRPVLPPLRPLSMASQNRDNQVSQKRDNPSPAVSPANVSFKDDSKKSMKSMKSIDRPAVPSPRLPLSFPPQGIDQSARRRIKKEVQTNTSDAAFRATANSFCTRYLSMGVAGLCSEWEKNIKLYSPPGATANAFFANPTKNRYKDMVCIDQSRVVLTWGQGPDYINANYVRGDPFVNDFICTQGPLTATVPDLWRMCMQEKVSHIVMLCEVMENGKRKCDQYWPENVGDVIVAGELSIKTLEISSLKAMKAGDGVTRIVEVSGGPLAKPRRLRHHIWKAWPDKNVPESKLSCLRLLKSVRQSTGTTVVHCSAGVGRTGTFVAIEMAFQELTRKVVDFNLLALVQKLRGMRMTAVQTELQYAYLVMVLATWLKRNNVLEEDTKRLLRIYERDYEQMVAVKIAGHPK